MDHQQSPRLGSCRDGGSFLCGKGCGGPGALEKRPGRRYKGPLDKGGYRQGKGHWAHSEARKGAQRATQGALRSFYRIRGYSGGKPPAPRQTARQPVNQHSEERAGPPVPIRPQGGLSGPEILDNGQWTLLGCRSTPGDRGIFPVIFIQIAQKRP